MVVGHLHQGDPALTRHQALLLIDEESRLVGMVTRGYIVRGLGRDATGTMSVADAGSRQLVVTYPDELVNDALAKMLRTNVGRLPVVSRHDPQRWVGYLGRATILNARLTRLEEEEVRESGWLRTSSAK